MVLKPSAPKSKSRLDPWIWVLIFGGMLCMALGLTLRGRDAALGTGVAIFAGAAIVFGIVLIWVRSRQPGDGD